jgi:glycosyltransferase involved in cell wall biosynthesis
MIFLNAEEFIHEAIESVLAQTHDHWELLLVDDGSVDRSTTIALEFASRHSEKVHYLDHPGHQNSGMSASRNLGIRHSTGEYIAFLDADDTWLPEKLAHQVKIITSHPEVGMIYGNTLYWHSWTGRPEDKTQDRIPALGTMPNTVINPPQMLQRYLSGQAAVPCTCSILVRSKTVKRKVSFEESFRGMYEDQVFYAKLSLTEPIFVSEACLDRYRQHPNSSTTITATTGQTNATRLKFLNWLTQYLMEQNVDDTALWMTLRKELWMVKLPLSVPMADPFCFLIRWMKKWVLRLETRLLPVSVRLWIWTRDLKH